MEWLQASEAWATLKPGPRALYMELKRRFRGHNNGSIFLSHRDAAKALNCGRDTVAKYFKELEHRGFIVVTKGHCLGHEGVGRAAHYRLTEEPYKSKPATKEFMDWRKPKKQKPSRKNRHDMAEKTNIPSRKNQLLGNQMSENPSSSELFGSPVVSENPAISTSSHMYSVFQQRMESGSGLCGKASPKAAQPAKVRSGFRAVGKVRPVRSSDLNKGLARPLQDLRSRK